MSNSQKFIGIGLNYTDHAEETGMKIPNEPIIFIKAKKKTIDHTNPAELGITLEPRVRLLGMELINSQRNCVKVNSAIELLEKLRETEVVN